LKLLIFILFTYLVYADEKPITPILYKVTHPNQPNTLWLLGTMHGVIRLSDFPHYIKHLVLASNQFFTELSGVIEKIYDRLNLPPRTIPKNLFYQQMIENSLTSYLKKNSYSDLTLDLEIALLTYLMGTESVSLDDDCITSEWLDKLIFGLKLGLYTVVPKWQEPYLEAYKNGDIKAALEYSKDGKLASIRGERELIWIDKILKKLNDKQLISLVAVGAAHLQYGENRLLSLFENNGWTVEKFDPNNTVGVTALEDSLRVAQLDITSHSTLTE
jgi:hypothetical protein